MIAKAITGRRDQVLIATKFGNLALASRDAAGADPTLTGGHPDYVVRACEKSCKRLARSSSVPRASLSLRDKHLA